MISLEQGWRILSTIERKDLVAAVLASRDELDPDLDTELLTAVVDAEADAAGDGDVALRAVERVVETAILRGVAAEPGNAGDVSADEEDEP